MVGDLARGKTVRSLSYLLAKFPDIKIYFISPKAARMRDDIKDYLKEQRVWFKEGNDLRKVVPEVDEDPRAAYFRQAENGLYVRMALLKMILAP